MRTIPILAAALVACVVVGAAWAEDAATAEGKSSPSIKPDGFHLTPAMLTVNSADNTDAKTTLGLEFDFQKTWHHIQSGTADGWEGTVNADGRMAFDRKQPVGDLVDINVNYSYKYLIVPTIEGETFSPRPDSGYGYFKSGLKAGIQTNQQFDSKQTVLALEARGFYTSFYLPDALINLPPAITLGYERVAPQNDADRAKVDSSLNPFSRMHVLLSSSVLLGRIAGGRDIKLEAKVEHWREIGPSTAIEDAGLNRQTYRAIGLREASQNNNEGWSITYSSGKVPTDKASSKVWQLGYTISGNPL